MGKRLLICEAPPGPEHGLPRAARHGSGTLAITHRHVARVEAVGVAVGKEVRRSHGGEIGHAHRLRNEASPGLNMRPVGPSRLRSGRRLRAREAAARDLVDAMMATGQTNPDVAAALDFAPEDVRDIRIAKKPFEVGHLDMLPGEIAAILLARRVARLGMEALERFELEVRLARGAA